MAWVRWLHRWLGVAVGLVMAVWCLSGFVMMYVSYPYFTEAERLRGLPVLDAACCTMPTVGLPAEAVVAGWSLRMLGSTPVLRISADARRSRASRSPAAFDLGSGRPLAAMTRDDTAVAARAYGRALGLPGAPRFVRELGYDQWTVQGARGRAPLHLYAWHDEARTRIHVSTATGDVLQATTRRERFWNWLGAVPHWLYPTLLRANGALWSGVVITLASVGTVLTAIGLWLGVDRFRQRRRGRLSPYRGLWEWHHVAGLVFGVLTLTWVGSGLLSMNPWGLLEGEAGPAERQALAGEPIEWRRWSVDLGEVLRRVRVQLPGVVELRSAPLAGQAYLVASTASGERRRFDARGEPAPLQRPELERALDDLGPRAGAPELLVEGDDYFYRAKAGDAVPLPVWRAGLLNAGAVQVYVDPVSGALLRAVDPPQRRFRWWHSALHSLDFAALRSRPVWGVVTLVLLAGVTLVTLSGAWLSWRVLRR